MEWVLNAAGAVLFRAVPHKKAAARHGRSARGAMRDEKEMPAWRLDAMLFDLWQPRHALLRTRAASGVFLRIATLEFVCGTG
jgi:hypothetical protein